MQSRFVWTGWRVSLFLLSRLLLLLERDLIKPEKSNLIASEWNALRICIVAIWYDAFNHNANSFGSFMKPIIALRISNEFKRFFSFWWIFDKYFRSKKRDHPLEWSSIYKLQYLAVSNWIGLLEYNNFSSVTCTL